MSLVPLPSIGTEPNGDESISPVSLSVPNQAELSASPIILSAALKQLADLAKVALQHQQDCFQQLTEYAKASEDRIERKHNEELERERSRAHEFLQQQLLLAEANYNRQRLQQELQHTQDTLERLRGQKDTDLASSFPTIPQTKSVKVSLVPKKRGRPTVPSASPYLQPPPKKTQPSVSAGWSHLPPLPSLLPTP